MVMAGLCMFGMVAMSFGNLLHASKPESWASGHPRSIHCQNPAAALHSGWLFLLTWPLLTCAHLLIAMCVFIYAVSTGPGRISIQSKADMSKSQVLMPCMLYISTSVSDRGLLLLCWMRFYVPLAIAGN